MSHFSFLKSEWPEIHFAAAKAEVLLSTDPRTACFYARRSLELAVGWLYEHDTTLTDLYARDLSARIHETAFRNLVGPSLLTISDPCLMWCSTIRSANGSCLWNSSPATDRWTESAMKNSPDSPPNPDLEPRTQGAGRRPRRRQTRRTLRSRRRRRPQSDH